MIEMTHWDQSSEKTIPSCGKELKGFVQETTVCHLQIVSNTFRLTFIDFQQTVENSMLKNFKQNQKFL